MSVDTILHVLISKNVEGGWYKINLTKEIGLKMKVSLISSNQFQLVWECYDLISIGNFRKIIVKFWTPKHLGRECAIMKEDLITFFKDCQPKHLLDSSLK